MSQPAQRGLVDPLAVVDSNHQGPGVREIGGQPVERMQNREGRVGGPRFADLAQEQRAGRCGGTAEEPVALGCRSSRDSPFKQLSDDSEREPRLEF